MANNLAELRKIVYKSVEDVHEIHLDNENNNYVKLLSFGEGCTLDFSVDVEYFTDKNMNHTAVIKKAVFNIVNGEIISAEKCSNQATRDENGNQVSVDSFEFYRGEGADESFLFMLLNKKDSKVTTITNIISDSKNTIRLFDPNKEENGITTESGMGTKKDFIISNGGDVFSNRNIHFSPFTESFLSTSSLITNTLENALTVDYLHVTKGFTNANGDTTNSAGSGNVEKSTVQGNYIAAESSLIKNEGNNRGFEFAGILFLWDIDQNRFNGKDSQSFLDNNSFYSYINGSYQTVNEVEFVYSTSGVFDENIISFSVKVNASTIETIVLKNYAQELDILKSIVLDSRYKKLDASDDDFDENNNYNGEQPRLEISYKYKSETENSGIELPSKIKTTITNDNLKIGENVELNGEDPKLKISTSTLTGESLEIVKMLNSEDPKLISTSTLTGESLKIGENVKLDKEELTISNTKLSNTGLSIGENVELNGEQLKISSWTQSIDNSNDKCDLVFICSNT